MVRAFAVTAVTVAPVLLLVATAEPFGAYHLSALAHGLGAESEGSEVVHLLPYDSPAQGRSPFRCVADAGVLERADRVVVVGGGLSPWTELAARRAVALGVPLLYTQLAKFSSCFPGDIPVRLATAFTAHEAEMFAAVWPGASVRVTGSPLLDEPFGAVRETGRVLVLSTAEVRERDPGRVLPRLASELATTHPLAVRPHPREVPGFWGSASARVGILRSTGGRRRSGAGLRGESGAGGRVQGCEGGAIPSARVRARDPQLNGSCSAGEHRIDPR